MKSRLISYPCSIFLVTIIIVTCVPAVSAQPVICPVPAENVSSPWDPPEPPQASTKIAMNWEPVGQAPEGGLQVLFTLNPYLVLDLGSSGFLYLLRENDLTGHEWLSYEQYMEAGRWKTRDVIPDMKQGTHTFRIWFFSNGIWIRTALSKQVDNHVHNANYFPVVKFWAKTADNATESRVKLCWDISDNPNASDNVSEVKLVVPSRAPYYGFKSGTKEVTLSNEEINSIALYAKNRAGTIASKITVSARQINSPAQNKAPATDNHTTTQTPVDQSHTQINAKPREAVDNTMETSLWDQVRASLSGQSSSLLLSGLLFVIVGVSCGILLARRRKPHLAGADVKPRQPSGNPITRLRKRHAATADRAKLILPNNSKITLDTGVKRIGRADLARALSPGELLLVSREQFVIGSDGNTYYIEDKTSYNGTRLVGVDIRDKGRQQLKDFDVIEIAGVLSITFNMPPFSSKPHDV